jgi:hypothetical protein
MSVCEAEGMTLCEPAEGDGRKDEASGDEVEGDGGASGDEAGDDGGASGDEAGEGDAGETPRPPCTAHGCEKVSIDTCGRCTAPRCESHIGYTRQFTGTPKSACMMLCPSEEEAKMRFDAAQERCAAQRAAHSAKMTAHLERVCDEDPSAMRRIAARFALAGGVVSPPPGTVPMNVCFFIVVMIIYVAGTVACLSASNLSASNLEPQHYVFIAIGGYWGLILFTSAAGGIFAAREVDRVYEAERLAREAAERAAKDE